MGLAGGFSFPLLQLTESQAAHNVVQSFQRLRPRLVLLCVLLSSERPSPSVRYGSLCFCAAPDTRRHNCLPGLFVSFTLQRQAKFSIQRRAVTGKKRKISCVPNLANLDWVALASCSRKPSHSQAIQAEKMQKIAKKCKQETERSTTSCGNLI